ncbi:MAG: Rieske 2Fe-2S domain-containing protein [Pseudomonadales bacterium]|jgi:phenylpropionate dioxygenase-like ring-hydroxylating dioxygenase large terminal subunit
MSSIKTLELRDETTSQSEEAFDWRNCWYPVSFLRDLPRERPTGFSIYDEPLVLFFDGDGVLTCMDDRCPHRSARLSDGQLIDGRLECLYHGWQFGAGGRCLRIPQAPEGFGIPEKACVRSYPLRIVKDMVWVWMGDPEQTESRPIPVTECIGDPDVTCVDFQMDLPYDQSYLIENVIDIAHIHIAHHGMRGGGHRDAALPMKFKILKNSVEGIRSGFRTIRPGMTGDEEDPVLRGAYVDYVAPNLIRYDSEYRDESLKAGLDLYSLPLGKSRCRLLYRKYSNFTSRREAMKPRWLEHWTQCLILEQDMGVVVGQHEQIEKSEGPLKDMWLPLATSDRLVIEYRKWLDRFGANLPFYRGWTTAKASGDDPDIRKLSWDRYTLHTRICATCSRMHRNLGRANQGVLAVAAVAAGLGIVTDGWVSILSVAGALGLLGAATGIRRLRRRFE